MRGKSRFFLVAEADDFFVVAFFAVAFFAVVGI